MESWRTVRGRQCREQGEEDRLVHQRGLRSCCVPPASCGLAAGSATVSGDRRSCKGPSFFLPGDYGDHLPCPSLELHKGSAVRVLARLGLFPVLSVLPMIVRLFL